MDDSPILENVLTVDDVNVYSARAPCTEVMPDVKELNGFGVVRTQRVTGSLASLHRYERCTYGQG